MNLDAVSKKATNFKIGRVEQKLWKICQNAGVKIIFTVKKSDRKNWRSFDSNPFESFCQWILNPNFIAVLDSFQLFPPFSTFGRYIALFESDHTIFHMNFEFKLKKWKKGQK